MSWLLAAVSARFPVKVKGENVYAAFGQTAGGRYLVVFYIRKLTGAALPISVRNMDDGERKYYGKQK